MECPSSNFFYYFIILEHGDYFCIAVAGYPEVHTEAWNNPDLPPSQQVKSLDISRLVEKVNAGVDFVITQFFYDVSLFFDFYKECRRAGITVPILPGYLPIQNYRSFKKFTTWCKTAIPVSVGNSIEDVKDDDAKVSKRRAHIYEHELKQ